MGKSIRCAQYAPTGKAGITCADILPAGCVLIHHSTVVAVTGCVSAIVHTLNQHLQFAARAEKSLGLSKSYQNVVSKIEAELNLMKTEAATSGGGAAHPALHIPAALTEGPAGMLAGKIPGFGALAGGSEAAPASSSSSPAAAAGPTTATKAKFLSMIQTEISALDGSIDDMPSALSAVAETAVGLAAVSTFCCFKRHKPAVALPTAKELPALHMPAALGGKPDVEAGGASPKGSIRSATPRSRAPAHESSTAPARSKPKGPGSARGESVERPGGERSAPGREPPKERRGGGGAGLEDAL
jgi:hypothetical protein